MQANKNKIKSVLIVKNCSFLNGYSLGNCSLYGCYLEGCFLDNCPLDGYFLAHKIFGSSNLWIAVLFRETVGLGLCFETHH